MIDPTSSLASRHIALLGAMGSGKSTVGAALAALVDRPFVDTDALVEQRAGASIAELFAEVGEPQFRALEHRALLQALSSPSPSVVATGGGVVTFEPNLTLLNDSATVVWLVAPVEVLADRVGDGSSRPLLHGGSHRQALAELLEARRPLYRDASDIEVDAARGTPHDVAVSILDALGAHA